MNNVAFITTLATLGVMALVFAFASYLVGAFGYYKLFTKAGEAGWKGFVPVYNYYVALKLSWNTNIFWIYLAITIVSSILRQFEGFVATLGSVVGIAATIINLVHCLKFSRAFQHGIGYALGLFFLEPIFLLIMGLGDTQYVGPQE